MNSIGELSFPTILRKVESGDIAASELFIGGEIAEALDDEARKILTGAFIGRGIKALSSELKRRISVDLNLDVRTTGE